MQFYFNTSYKGSPTGFQQSWICEKGDQLAFLSKDVSMSPLTKSAMRNGGTRCAAGRYQKGVYFVFRGLEATDHTGRPWYVNLGIEADLEERDSFFRIVQKILVEHDAFLNALGSWFSPGEGALSYRIDAEEFHKFLSYPGRRTIRGPYYRKENYYVVMLKHFLKDLENGLTHRLQLLVPERSAAYFHKMNPVFEGCYAAYTMEEQPFLLLLGRDPALYTHAQPLQPWKYLPVPEAEQLKTLRKTLRVGLIIACTAAMLNAAYWIANTIFEEERK